MKKVLFLAATAFVLSSCYNTKVYVGNVKKEDKVVKVKSVTNTHLIGGLVPLGSAKVDPKPYVGDRTDYVVKTNQTFWNGLLGGITMGIYTPTTTTFYVPANSK